MNKQGLEYFSFDVDFFQDEKIQFISSRFGMKGELVTVRLLCKIYRQGYYTDWNNDIALLFAKSVGDGCQHSFVNDVVNELLKRGFFDKNIFERFSILTSRGIQKRYFTAIERRKIKEVRKELLLINISGQNVDISGENVDISGQNVDISGQNVDIFKQSKVKESKEEESKNSFDAELGKSAQDIPTANAVDQKEIVPVSKSVKKKRYLELTEDQKLLFQAAKACFEKYEKSKEIMYQDKGSAQMQMENLKLFVVRCTKMAPGIPADFMRNVLEHFKVIVNGKLKSKVEFTPRALITPWIWETVIGSLPEADNEQTVRIRESIRGIFQ